MKTKKKFESRWFATAVTCFVLIVMLFSGCPTDGSSSSNNNNGNDVISGVPDTYNLPDIWGSLASGLGRWDSNCGGYNARFERRQNLEIYQLAFGATNWSTPTLGMDWGIGNMFNIGGSANSPFNFEPRLSLGRNAEGDVTWVIRNSGLAGNMRSRGVIRFDYYESEIRRVMFYVEQFDDPFGCMLFKTGDLNGTWLHRRQH